MYSSVIVNSWWHTLSPVQYGFESCQPGHHWGPHVRSYYLLHYVLSGEGWFEESGNRHALKQDDIFIIRPGEVTTYQASAHSPWQYAWLGFQVEQAPDFLRQSVIHQPAVRAIFEQIRDMEFQPGNWDGIVFSLTYSLLWKLSSAVLEKLPCSYAQYAKTYLEANYMRPVAIQELADTLHIDRRYLTARFREAFGVPPQVFLMELRMEKAREFLCDGHSVTEVAAMVGFPDIPGFSRRYKKHFGIPPSRQVRR